MFRSPLALVALTAFALASSACGQAVDPSAQRLENSPRHHEWVDVTTESGRKVRCLVVFPEVDKPVHAVVVIHENQGLNAWAKSVTDQVAEAGYVAIAPDLLSGTAPDGGNTDDYPSGNAARDGIYKLPPEQVLADIDAAVAYIKTQTACDGTVAVAGFCWGGSIAFSYAAHNPEIAASFVFYGSAPGPETLDKIQVPVHGFYGSNDFRITGAVPEVAEAMKSRNKTFDPVIYEGAGHGFMRSGEAPNAEAANREGRSQAWERWKSLLKGL